MKNYASLSLTILLVAACSATNAICPKDSTADLSLSITQITDPRVSPVPVSDKDPVAERNGSARQVWPIQVQYAVDVTNLSASTMRLTQISLEQPHMVGYRPEVECFAVDTLGPPFEATTLGVDEMMPPGGRARVVVRVTEHRSASIQQPEASAMTARIRVEADGRIRSESLTTKVVPYSKQAARNRG